MYNILYYKLKGRFMIQKVSGTSKIKTQKIIDRIESGEFDEMDVDNLLMYLRDFSNNYIVFREISNFVAHNNKRDKGLATDSLEAFYLNLKYFIEYPSENKQLDISKPFPIYIKKLMEYQVDKCKSIDLKSKFDTTKLKLKSKIKSLFEEDKKESTAVLRNIKISKKNIKAIEFLLSFISSMPTFTQKDLLNEIVQVIKDNDLIFDERKFLLQGERLTLCILMLLHDSKFDFKGHKLGSCKISCENTYIPHNIQLLNADGSISQHIGTFGNLEITGSIIVDKNGKDLTISYPLITTNLKVEEWCHENLFMIKPINETSPKLLYKFVDFDCELNFEENGKLSQL